jgi:predicted nucleotidyltransferase
LAELKVIFLKVKRKVSLEEELERVVSQISLLAPEKIVLFKDLVRGKMSKNSEIALLVVGESRKKFWERAQELIENLQPKKAITLLYLTPQEFKALSDSGNSDFHQILNEGKVIYEREEKGSN